MGRRGSLAPVGMGALLLCLAAAVNPVRAAPAPLSPQAQRTALELNALPAKPAPHTKHPPIDHSGRKQAGKASYYAGKFDGRKMADGRRFNPHANVAASKSLPLGTTAQVVNLKNGKTAVVSIQDRGPHIDGRVIDVTPKVARKLGMKKKGVVPVIVKPIAVPQPNGRVKLGAGATTVPHRQVVESVHKTERLSSR